MKRFSRFMIIGMMFSLLTGCGYNTMQANEEAVFAAWGDVEATYRIGAEYQSMDAKLKELWDEWVRIGKELEQGERLGAE